MTIKNLAQACDVAESTVTRFVRETGCSSYQSLKIKIAHALSDSEKTKDSSPQSDYIYEDIKINESTPSIIEKIFYRNLRAMKNTKELLNYEVLEEAAALIANAELILFSGIGSSAIACSEGAIRFTRAGKKCFFPNDTIMQLMVSTCATDNTLIIAISHSGETDSVIKTVEYAKTHGGKSICITSEPNSTLAQVSDLCIFTSKDTNLINTSEGWESTVAKASQILVMDTLYGVYASNNYTAVLDGLNKSFRSVKDTRSKQ